MRATRVEVVDSERFVDRFPGNDGAKEVVGLAVEERGEVDRPLAARDEERKAGGGRSQILALDQGDRLAGSPPVDDPVDALGRGRGIKSPAIELDGIAGPEGARGGLADKVGHLPPLSEQAEVACSDLWWEPGREQ